MYLEYTERTPIPLVVHKYRSAVSLAVAESKSQTMTPAPNLNVLS